MSEGGFSPEGADYKIGESAVADSLKKSSEGIAVTDVNVKPQWVKDSPGQQEKTSYVKTVYIDGKAHSKMMIGKEPTIKNPTWEGIISDKTKILNPKGSEKPLKSFSKWKVGEETAELEWEASKNAGGVVADTIKRIEPQPQKQGQEGKLISKWKVGGDKVPDIKK